MGIEIGVMVACGVGVGRCVGPSQAEGSVPHVWLLGGI